MERLVRWDPTTGFMRLRDDLNRLLEDFFGETTEERAPMEMMRVPTVDIVDKGDDVMVHAELPGVDKDSVQVEATPTTLTLHADVQKTTEDKGENFVRRERRMGSFHRVVPMPVEVNPSGVSAHYHDGVLDITLPKSETARAKQPVKIKIE